MPIIRSPAITRFIFYNRRYSRRKKIKRCWNYGQFTSNLYSISQKKKTSMFLIKKDEHVSVTGCGVPYIKTVNKPFQNVTPISLQTFFLTLKSSPCLQPGEFSSSWLQFLELGDKSYRNGLVCKSDNRIFEIVLCLKKKLCSSHCK